MFAVPADLAELERRASLLDVLKDDTTSLIQRVGERDKERLDQHLTHFRSIERRLTAVRANCSTPEPVDPAETFEGERQNMEKLDVMGDILVAALRCGMSRVFTMMFTTSASIMRKPSYSRSRGTSRGDGPRDPSGEPFRHIYYRGNNDTPGAYREGDWKYKVPVESNEQGYNKYMHGELLFNLADDPGEQNDLSAVMPDMLMEMKTKMQTYDAELKADPLR